MFMFDVVFVFFVFMFIFVFKFMFVGLVFAVVGFHFG